MSPTVNPHHKSNSRLRLLAILTLLAALLLPRIVLMLVAPTVPGNDALAYLLMAEDFAAGRPMQDQWGQYAFYSAGYPIVLGLAFLPGGPSLPVALLLNTALGLMTLWLVIRLARELGGDGLVQWLAAIGYALWIPAAYGAGLVQRENLSTPLLLVVLLAVLHLRRGASSKLAAAIGGASFGFGLIAGASGALVGLLFPAALWCLLKREGFQQAVKAGAIAASALALTVGPWLAYTNTQLGSPVLNSNSGFNFYLGNNPAANGSFVGIQDTPMGPSWHAFLARVGEVGAARQLQDNAVDWIIQNPAKASALAVHKLVLFWTPNVPDSVDRASSQATFWLRWIDVAQFIVVLSLAATALVFQRKTHPAMNWTASAIGLFWLLHAAAYVMPRYREPVMPMLIVLAAFTIGHAWARCWARRSSASRMRHR